jgi:signal peptidase
MEPAFRRGDLLFLTHDTEAPIRIGEIVVYKLPGREIPIVHRVLDLHEWSVESTFKVSSLFSLSLVHSSIHFSLFIE